VGLFHPTADQVHDGFTLAAYLNERGLGCALRRYWLGTPRGLGSSELVAAAGEVIFLSAGEENLEQVLALSRLLCRRRSVVLFGRQLADSDLRQEALDAGVDAVITGDARPVARDLLRAMARSGDEGLPARVPGLLRDGAAPVPREPPRHLEAFPPGDYSYEPTQVDLAIPLRQSLGFPFPATSLAERVWEAPLRGVAPERTLEIIRHHVEAHGARRFVFTDLAANAAGEDLLQVARGLSQQGPEVLWYGPLWPDPALDREALHLLRRSGCRGIWLQLWTGSAALARRLGLGVDPAAALTLCDDAAAEGIPVAARLQVGAPGETAEDRIATLAWLRLAAHDLWSLDELGPCVIRAGAPLRGDPDLVFPAQQPRSNWHDGGENNDSKRKVWLREARTVCAGADLRHPGQLGRQFAAMVEPSVRRRLDAAVDQALAGSARWVGRRLSMGGVLHGREAFAGPETLHLDLGGMAPEAARQVVTEAAAMGSRDLVLGRHGAEVDALTFEPLADLLALCRRSRLRVRLRTRLQGFEAESALPLMASFGALELTCACEDDLVQLAGPVTAVVQERTRLAELLPRVELTAWIGPDLPSPAAVAQAADAMGVDALVLRAVRDPDRLLDEEGRVIAGDEVEALAGLALEQEADGDSLLLERAGPSWPDGFQLVARDGGRPGARCTALKQAREVVHQPGHPGLRLARFDEETCQLCEHLRACPVSRLDYSVALRPLRVEGCAELVEDLKHPDMGFGLAGRTAERRPCLAGWDTARVTPGGDLHVCPSCSVEPVGNILEGSLAGVWYSRGLNEYRRMSVGASLALPYIDRNLCAMGCGRRGQDLELVERIRALSSEQLAALQGVGAGDRLGS